MFVCRLLTPTPKIMSEIAFPEQGHLRRQLDQTLMEDTGIENLIIVVRADPIICGHSTEARN